MNQQKEINVSYAYGKDVRNSFGKDVKDDVTGRASKPDSHSRRIEDAYLRIISYFNKKYPSNEEIDTAVPAVAKEFNLKE